MGQRADLALAALVIGIIAMMLIPMPTWLLDLLLTFNIASAAVLLLVGLSIPGITALSSLPGVLLLMVLLRLSLNVSTTRLILLDADAGQVIESFGGFVVQGSLLVGAVVFLILTLIQFLVVARGSERVAEVAARFSLDAMPGRQMAIDADLRSGAIGLEQARQSRRELQWESQLYGAMDGAMKFVKGDAIAGIIITAINICGGLAIGVGQRGMGLGEAAEVYGLLTIGDGLVSQIPSLLIATAAGVCVTRVASRGEHLGESIVRQVAAWPRALGIAAVLLIGLGLVPGLPLVPFVALGVACGLAARAAQRHGASEAVEEARAEPELAPLSVALSPEFDARANGEAFERLREGWSSRAKAIARQTGIEVPPLRVSEHAAPESGVSIFVHEIQAARSEAIGEGSEAVEKALGSIETAVRARLRAFVGLQEVHEALGRLRETAPADVDAVVPRVVSLAELVEVMGALVDERVPVRNLRAILGALALGPEKGAEGTLDARLQAVRRGLGRAIVADLNPEGGPLEVYTVERDIEDMVRDGVRGGTLMLPPDIARQITRAAGHLYGERDDRPVVLCAPDVRRHLRGLLARQRPDVVVVSHAELPPEQAMVPLGRLSVKDV